jgi:site-specific DNA recombinase
MEHSKRVGIYARQSVEKEAKHSIEDQISKGIKYAENLNIEFQVYEDRDETARHDTTGNRPEFEKMLQDIASNKITVVYAMDFSRLSRSPIVTFQLIALLVKNDVRIDTSFDGSYNFTESADVMRAGMQSMFNQDYARKTQQKVSSVLKKRAMEGGSYAGIPPYGYASGNGKKLVIHAERAEIVKEIYQMSLLGMGTGTIAKALNTRGIPCTYHSKKNETYSVKNRHTGEYTVKNSNEAKWVGNSVLGILKNTVFKGQRKYGTDTIPAPAIIDVETWDKVQVTLKGNARLGGKVKHNYLLRGLCVCGRCGRNFVGKTRDNKKDHYYGCSSKLVEGKNCGIRSLNIDYLDELIWHKVINSHVITDLALKEVEKLENPLEIENTKNKIHSLQSQLNKENGIKERTIELYQNGLIDLAKTKEKLEPCGTRIESISKEIEALKMLLVSFDDFKSQISEHEKFSEQLKSVVDRADFDFKFKLVRQYIDRITINYDDADELYTIDVLVNLSPNGREFYGATKELHQFYLQRGETPNILDYDISKDKYVKNYKPISSGDAIYKLYPPRLIESSH